MQTHIGWFRHSSLKSFVGKTDSTLITRRNTGGGPRIAHVAEGAAKAASKNTVGISLDSTIFGFSSGRNDHRNKSRKTEHRVVWKGGLILNTEKVAPPATLPE